MDTIAIAALMALKIMCGFEGIEEISNNRHPIIDKMNRRIGVPIGSNYCATSISFALDSAQTKMARRTAVAQGFITKNSHKSSDVLLGIHRPTAGDLVVWKLGSTWKGHVGMIVWWWEAKGFTIEGNTSQEGSSNGRGTGFYLKNRLIDPTNYFRITHFTPVY